MDGEQKSSFILLNKFEDIFKGTLGTWKNDPDDFWKDDVNPIWTLTLPVKNLLDSKFKNKQEVYKGILKKANESKWGAPYLSRLVPYFGGWSLDMDPNFGRYWNFCGTIINVHTDRNPYKRGKQH